MRSLRRLSVVSIASLPAILFLCSAGVRAQTTAAPPTQPALSPTPAPFVVQISPSLWAGQTSAPQQPGSSPNFRLPPLAPGAINSLKALDAQQLDLLARNNGPCFALRSYNFTTEHYAAAPPRLSSYTTCTPASQAHVKELVKTPSGR
ncbi:MAG TPA: hypothetical protein VN734_02085 [Acidobacteriaceae bacterium]|nr:hypothetical protein [Acidobacteriaceae bacterium]